MSAAGKTWHAGRVHSSEKWFYGASELHILFSSSKGDFCLLLLT
jgi:hypothetical protein